MNEEIVRALTAERFSKTPSWGRTSGAPTTFEPDNDLTCARRRHELVADDNHRTMQESA